MDLPQGNIWKFLKKYDGLAFELFKLDWNSYVI